MKPHDNDKKMKEEDEGGYGDNKAGDNTTQRDLGKAIKDAFQNNTDMLHDDLANKSLAGKLKDLKDAILAAYERKLGKIYSLLKEGPKKEKVHNKTPKFRR